MPKSFRLPSHVLPVNYNLLMDVDMEEFRFTGREDITLDIRKPSSGIILHSDGPDINGISLAVGGKRMAAKHVLKGDVLKIMLPERVKGTVNLIIDFAGKLNDDLLGFYRSKYAGKDGKTKYIASTQFEAPYARRAFPCFDEPQMKATFDVTLRVDSKLKVVSNMPVKQEIDEGTKRTVTFHRTPAMSTYLLYMGIGDFEFHETKIRDKIIRIVTVPGKGKQTAFALDIAKKFLSYFEDYSGIDYPLPKLDMIAMPDFSSGAMENWGAVTYREIYLLYDEQTTSTSYKKFMAMIIAHELWHQWSGDLVTMKWWNDLWLNESFATYMAYKAVDHLFPEWKMWEEFARGETIRAMEDDSLKATHPIECEVKNVSEIEQLFDAISYSKGANVLRMMEDYMGREDFKKGVADYLEANKYGNATSEDLWSALERASGKGMREIVKSWIRQPGFPMVDVEMRGNFLTLKQRRFLAGKATNALWKIPVTMNVDDAERRELLSTKMKRVHLDGVRWLKANYGQAGFYRVRYGKENLSALERKIMDKTLLVVDRWGLLDDMFKLSLNGFVALDDYLDFMKNYENEDSYLTLATVAGSLRAVHFAFCDEPYWGRIWPRFREHMKKPFARALARLSWSPRSNESKEDALMRELAISFLNFCEDVDTIGKGLQLFARYASGSSVHPDVRGSLLAVAASSGTERMNATLLDMYKNAGSTEEKVAILSALGQFRNVKILEGNLDFALSDSVRYQDLNVVIASASSNPSSRKIFIPWLERNWSAFEKRKNSGPTFLRAIDYIISAHTGMERDIANFFAAHPVEYKAMQRRAIEKLVRASLWVKKNRAGLERYFAKE